MPTLFHNHRLPNYVRAHRRRAGFSQDDVAFLLGSQSGTAVCRQEKLRRQPTLRTALQFEAVFRVPVRELFAGQYEQVEREVRHRAWILTRRLGRAPQNRHMAQKVEALHRIITRAETS